MTQYDMMDWLKKHEGFKAHPYLDTVGVVTIGYGRNLDDNGITEEEASYMLANDLNRAIKEVNYFPWFPSMPDSVKDALINMCFNMGLVRLMTFKRMLLALQKREFTIAAMEALDSKWAKQVGNRAKDIALMIREGK